MFRGGVEMMIENRGNKTLNIKPGDKVGQMIIVPVTHCTLVNCDLEKTQRGTSGFGSTGIKADEKFPVGLVKEKVTSSQDKEKEQILDFDFLYQLETISDEIDSVNNE